jgi:hypothetical protein
MVTQNMACLSRGGEGIEVVEGNRPIQWLRAALPGALALSLAACGNVSDVASGDVKMFRKGWFDRPTWASTDAPTAVNTRRVVTPSDLLGPDGTCASAAGPGEAAADGLLPGGIAVDMTECDVVQRAGRPEQFEFGSNARGERTLVMTYVRGAKPGIYKFESGRLVGMERAPEPTATAKPAKPAKPSSKPASARGV